VRIDVTPPLEEHAQRALLEALVETGVGSADDLYAQQWRAAGLREAADGEAEVAYAFSPRSTRGATRA
jgi:hypothetical protein